jgi:lipoate-protein ligase B
VLDASTLNVARFGLVDYGAALAIQDALVAARQRDVIGDTLLLLEHPATYTLGRGADARFILDSTADVPIYRVSRGGQVTFHGPGQLIGYPILKLEGADRDVIRYLRKLEQALIEALAACGIMAYRREGLTGVWVGTEKLASIGIGIRRWITLHGFAVNVATDLTAFDRIVPCGIEGCRMTSIAKLGHPEISLTAFAGLIERAFATVFGYAASEALEAGAVWSLIDAVAASTEAHG